MNRIFLIVTGWKSPYRGIDYEAHTLKLARSHKNELIVDCQLPRDDIAIIAIEGGDFTAAQDEISGLFVEGRPFGRKTAEKIAAAFGCDRIAILF